MNTEKGRPKTGRPFSVENETFSKKLELFQKVRTFPLRFCVSALILFACKAFDIKVRAQSDAKRHFPVSACTPVIPQLN